MPERPPVASFNHFVLKVASRCNLDCSYCYEYHHADQTWRTQPRFMSLDVAERAGDRIAEHARDHGLDTVHLSLHGGEPLLLGRGRLAALVEGLKARIGRSVAVTVSVQTNATLVDEAWLELFQEHRVLVNVSLDGPAEVNDRRRLDLVGAGSHGRVADALELLRGRGRDVFAGIYAVIDVAADPLEVVDHLASWDPPAIDLLLPDAHWSMPPARTGSDGDDYGRWLAAVFDAWYSERRWGPMLIYSLEQLIKLLLGGRGRMDSLGLAPFGAVGIATDGSYHALDVLKTTHEGASSLDADVRSASLDDLGAHPLIRAFRGRWQALSATCRACEWARSCGGGYYPHRYLEGAGFDRPSVYCADLEHLLQHVSDAIGASAGSVA